ncbi:MAG: 4Fe-4S cluster-binding domain-containing protein, partial [Bacteroidales bacterium]
MPTIVYPPRDLFVDFPDNKNNAIGLFFAGCSHYCLGCHNPELQHPENGNIFVNNVMDVMNRFLDFSKRFETKCVVLSGGDPLHPENREFVKQLTVELDMENFKVAIYTGYEVGAVKEMALTGF